MTTNHKATMSGDTRGTLQEDGCTNIARGDLDVKDADKGEAQVQAIASKAGKYGKFSISADGNWTYVLDNGLAATQALGEGRKVTESFVVLSKDGTASQTVVVTINGENDQGHISGTATGSVKEGLAVNTATGKLVVTDADTGEAAMLAVNGKAGSYGVFSLAEDGSWTYTLDNGNSSVQKLAEGATLTERFTVYSRDAGGDCDRTSKTIVVTIVGTNDAAVVGGKTSGAVAEDGVLAASGQMTVKDIEAGQASFVAQKNVATAFGTFSLGTDGKWTYALDNNKSGVQALGAGETALDTITVKTKDGTSQLITITVTGANDAASISGPASGSVAENGTQTASGLLAVTDRDHGQAQFQPLADVAGTYGSFSITAAGQWNYVLDAADADLVALNSGEARTESFTVRSSDGTASKTVIINVAGDGAPGPVLNNDPAAARGAVVEDGSALAGGQLSAAGLAGATAPWSLVGGGAGQYGTLTLDAATGAWSYALDNSAAQVQALNANDVRTESFIARATDSHGQFVEQAVVVTVSGANDAATISGNATGGVAENGAASASGHLAISDVDQGQAAFQAVNHVAGTYGSFSITEQGNWTYALDASDPDLVALNTGDVRTDAFTVLSSDGTASKLVSISVAGDGGRPVATDDTVLPVVLTFEPGSYTSTRDHSNDGYGFAGDQEGLIITSEGFQLARSGTPGAGYGAFVGPAGSTTVAYSYGRMEIQPADMALTRADGGAFSLLSSNILSDVNTNFNASSYWGTMGHATVVGYLHGQQVAVQALDAPNFRLDNSNVASFTDAAWQGVDRVVFHMEVNVDFDNYFTMANILDDITLQRDVAHTVDINVLANDAPHAAGDTLSVASFSATSARGAAITLNADGSLHYDPRGSAQLQALSLRETVTDTFTYAVKDQNGVTSNIATASITVVGDNHAPVAHADSVTVTGTPRAAAPAGFIYNPDNGHYYAMTNDFVFGFGSWPSMQNIAGQVGGYLATITSAQENAFVQEHVLRGQQGYIGAVYEPAGADGTQGRWVWAGGPEAGTGIWSGGAPVGGAFSNWSSAPQGDASTPYGTLINPSTGDWSVYYAAQLGVVEIGGRPGDPDQSAFSAIDVAVLANDTDPDQGAHLAVTQLQVLSAFGANVSLNANGTVHYDPTHSAQVNALAAGQSVTDTFSYRAMDEYGALSALATVSVVLVGAA
ncbi:MAG: hypothetical protein HYX47_05130 [Burkholderiales bacterium]|nr:hypothetical protein [Burkholderiales bacterium]